MREPLLVAVAQPLCTPYDVAANAAAHAAAVRAAQARLVVFPELSLTGYHYDAPAIAADDPRLAPLVEACADGGALALAGAPVRGEVGARHIAMLAVDAQGARVAYRKRCPGREEAPHFAPGDAFGLLTIDGWRLGLSICRDTGILEHVQGTVAQGIDLFVAGILDAAEDLPRHHERYRRIAAEHGVWVAIASFAGGTGEGYAPAMGGSGIWAPGGELVAVAGGSPGEIAGAAIAERPPTTA